MSVHACAYRQLIRSMSPCTGATCTGCAFTWGLSALEPSFVLSIAMHRWCLTAARCNGLVVHCILPYVGIDLHIMHVVNTSATKAMMRRCSSIAANAHGAAICIDCAPSQTCTVHRHVPAAARRAPALLSGKARQLLSRRWRRRWRARRAARWPASQQRRAPRGTPQRAPSHRPAQCRRSAASPWTGSTARYTPPSALCAEAYGEPCRPQGHALPDVAVACQNT
jgi:hypothetical protein